MMPVKVDQQAIGLGGSGFDFGVGEMPQVELGGGLPQK